MESKKKHSGKAQISRRRFVKGAAVTAASFTIVPRYVLGGNRHKAPSDVINVVGVGVGGMGRGNLRNMVQKGEAKVVGLCDVDWKYSDKTFKDYPDAKKYWDFRKMYEEMKNDFDAVLVATPDHTHAIAAAQAMKMGKHVYVQKPLTHSVWESRRLREIANETGVVTQMGNQGNSGEGIRQVCEWIWNGDLGTIQEVHAWTNRPIWPQGLERPTEKFRLPKTLNWDLFLGPAPNRPYHPAYTPWNWRAWWDFGTGALGDMACHIMDPAFKAMKYGHPVAVEGSSSQVNTESAPLSEKVTYYFPARDNMKKVAFPECTFTWWDGGLMPDRPEGMEDGQMMGDWGGGNMFVGSKGTMICSTYGMDPYILGKPGYPAGPKTLRRPEEDTGLKWNEGAHEADWLAAIRKNDPDHPSSNFNYSGPLNEVVVMGNLGVRLQDLKRRLQWDGEAMKVTNIGDSDEIRVVTSDRFTVIDGDPKFDTQYATINAKQAAVEYVKHTYRDGWGGIL
ncbi:Gfo/Idh/MocA family protein [Bacteroidota bacterium]